MSGPTMLVLVTEEDGEFSTVFRNDDVLVVAAAVLLKMARKRGATLKEIFDLARKVKLGGEAYDVPEPIVMG